MKLSAIEKWHLCINEKIVESDALDESIMFYSPFVFKPIEGIEKVTQYLNAANSVIANDDFKYTEELVGDHTAFLSFETKVSDLYVNGIDYLTWNQDQKLTELRVFIRPFKGLTVVSEMMMKYL